SACRESQLLRLVGVDLVSVTPPMRRSVDHSESPSTSQKLSAASPHWCQLKPGIELVTCRPEAGPTAENARQVVRSGGGKLIDLLPYLLAGARLPPPLGLLRWRPQSVIRPHLHAARAACLQKLIEFLLERGIELVQVDGHKSLL